MYPKPQLKQFGDLNIGDFSEASIWIACHCTDYDEPWYEDTDEETFRPYDGLRPAHPEEGMLLVSAKMTLANGRTRDGFLTPQHDSEALNLGMIQPQLFLPSGLRVSFWDGMFKRPESQRNAVYAELGNNTEAIFRIQFQALDGLATGHVSGEIPGFCWCPEGIINVYT